MVLFVKIGSLVCGSTSRLGESGGTIKVAGFIGGRCFWTWRSGG